MPIWLLNPPKRRRKKKAKMATRSKRRPSRKQMAARRKFTAMAKARSRAARSRTRAPRKRTIMAAKRRRAAPKRRRVGSTLRSVRRHGHPANRRAFHRLGYARNPRRRRNTHHRVRHRRNPGLRMGGILGLTFNLGKEAIATLAGQTLERTVSAAIPFGGTSPLANFAKGAIVAVGIKKVGPRVLPSDLVNALAVGAMMGPIKDLIVAYFPQAGKFLGAYSGGVTFMPPIRGQRSLSSYAGGDVEIDSEMGSYSGDVVQ